MIISRLSCHHLSRKALMNDSEKLRKLAEWFDFVQDHPRTREIFPNWSSSREVQQDLRRIANEIEKIS